MDEAPRVSDQHAALAALFTELEGQLRDKQRAMRKDNATIVARRLGEEAARFGALASYAERRSRESAEHEKTGEKT